MRRAGTTHPTARDLRRARAGGRRIGLRMLAVLAVLGLFAADAPGNPEEEEVLLRSGTLLHGRVRGRETVRGRRMVRIETDFGVIRVDASQVRRAPEGEPADDVFFFQRVRVARIRGDVEKRAPGSDAWVPVRFRDEYGPIENAPDALVGPGDTVRTRSSSFIDLMPHRGVWLRIMPGSEVRLPAERGPASVVLLRGTTLQRIDGRPRGKRFVVGLPSRTVTVAGTEFLTAVGDGERVSVTHGEVDVGGQKRVGAGETGRWSEGGTVEVGAIDPADAETITVEAIRLPEEDMVYVPGGTYRMGGRGEDDAPGRKVKLAGYLIDRREATNEEYARFAEATETGVPSHFANRKPPEGEARHPVRDLTADMARSYAAWAGRRLPTEAQWEAAARGPRGLPFPWGSRPPAEGSPLPHVVVAGQNPARPVDLGPVDDDTIDVSPFGILGMLSGVPEWCRDWYAEDFYTRGKDEDPTGPSGGVWRVSRGHWPASGGGRTPSITARRRTAEDDDKAGTGVRGVVEPR